MFYIFLVIILCFIFSGLFYILKTMARSDKSALVFMEGLRNVVGGNISESKLFDYKLSLTGTYQGREIQCKYRRSAANADISPTILFGLRPLVAPQIRTFPFRYPKITETVILKRGLLVYEHNLTSPREPTEELVSEIFGQLVLAEEALEKKPIDLH